jgi:hypothetical protein
LPIIIINNGWKRHEGFVGWFSPANPNADENEHASEN